MSLASRKLIQATAGNAAEAASDDDFANVVLLLDGDGTSGDDNETFTDSSTNGYTVTESGSVVQGSFSPYGDNWSNYFDGSDDYLISDTNFTAIGTDDFTIEFWYNGGAQPARYPCIIGTLDAFSATGAWRVQTYDNNTNRFQFTSAITNYIFTTTNYNDGVWRHFAVTREGTNLRGFVNGVQQGSTQTMSDSFTSRKILMMSQLRDGGDQEGYVSNVRVIKGTALYTSDFTPPTAPLTAVTGTEFLSCQSNRFIDNSSNNFTLSANSTPKVTPFSPFKDDDARTLTTDGGSAYFASASEYLSASPAAPGTGDFCYECWINVPQGSDDAVWETRNANLSASGFTMTVIDADTIRIFSNNAKITANGLSYLNQWTHLCVEKVGSTTTMYINGTSYGTTTDFTNMSDTNFRVGDSQFYGAFSGYIADFRYVKGAYVYNGNFTPPTAPLTAIANTEVLLGFQDAGIYDRSGINNLDTVGNAQIDTAVKKYGTGSMQFDGTGDELLVYEESSSLTFGTGDFTVEFWVYWDSVSGIRVLLDWRNATGNQGNYITLYTNNSTLYFFRGANLINGTVTSAAWHHIALTREDSVTRLFINGTQAGSDLSDSTSYLKTQGGYMSVGGLNGSYSLNGYIDDLRITKGVARYTTSFTPPTDELPKF